MCFDFLELCLPPNQWSTRKSCCCSRYCQCERLSPNWVQFLPLPEDGEFLSGIGIWVILHLGFSDTLALHCCQLLGFSEIPEKVLVSRGVPRTNQCHRAGSPQSLTVTWHNSNHTAFHHNLNVVSTQDVSPCYKSDEPTILKGISSHMWLFLIMPRGRLPVTCHRPFSPTDAHF